MKNKSGSDFKSKFHLLNSQENSEEIVWSSSDSSDYENTYRNENLRSATKTVSRKRKREKTRKKTSNPVSPLNIEFVNTSIEDKSERNCEMSPILQKGILSPVLTKSQQYFAPINKKQVLTSPILSCNSKNTSFNTANKSPVIVLTRASPKISLNVRKNLFNNNSNPQIKQMHKENARSKSPLLNCSQITKKSRLRESTIENNALYNFNISDKYIKQELVEDESTVYNENVISNNNNIQGDEIRLNKRKENLNDTLSAKISSAALLGREKSYFDGHFSSETPSQHSISEYDTTPKDSSKTSEEIEIINSQSDSKCIPEMIKLEHRSSSDSLRSYEFCEEKTKKLRYKKGGLAHRLNTLLKKQKASISLWQHERFLAANSNFIIPNDNFTAFHIQNVIFEYGCYLVEVMDSLGKKYLIVINNLNMNSNNLEQCNVFKLYRPYNIIDYNSDYQLIVNVSKFECTSINR